MAVFGAGAASAACTVPSTLTNGQTADASQVMANFTAVAGCVNSQPAGATNSVQTNGGSGALGAVGPLINGQLVIGSTGAAPQAANLTAGSGIAITNGAGSITIAASGASGAGVGAPRGRLTLISGTPVMAANVTGAASLYYDCYAGKSVPYYTGVADAAAQITSCEVSTALQTSGTGAVNGGDVFDVFWAQNASTICVATNGSGGGWSADAGGSITGRGTGYSQVHNARGYWTNANSLTHCYNGAVDEGPIAADQASYLGSLYTTAAGQTGVNAHPVAAVGGGSPYWFLYNAYNRVRAALVNLESGTWNYTTNAWRKENNSAADRATILDGLGQSALSFRWQQADYESASGYNHAYAIIKDATSLSGYGGGCGGIASFCTFASGPTSSFGSVFQLSIIGAFAPAAGVHFFQIMEGNNGGGSWTQNQAGSAALALEFDD
jgi:hypothetical protein